MVLGDRLHMRTPLILGLAAMMWAVPCAAASSVLPVGMPQSGPRPSAETSGPVAPTEVKSSPAASSAASTALPAQSTATGATGTGVKSPNVSTAQSNGPESVKPGSVKAEFTPIVREQEGVYGKTTAAAGKDLMLHGVGLCEWGIFGIDLYYCALYAERRMETAEQAIVGDQVLVIHLDFARKLTAAQLSEAFTAATKVNVGEAMPTYQKALATLCAAMRDVAAGDTYTFVLAPQKGIEVRRNGERVAVIGDEPFRVLFQRLYLGDKPPTQELRTGMLGWKS
jgi:hypothetical protein